MHAIVAWRVMSKENSSGTQDKKKAKKSKKSKKIKKSKKSKKETGDKNRAEAKITPTTPAISDAATLSEAALKKFPSSTVRELFLLVL